MERVTQEQIDAALDEVREARNALDRKSDALRCIMEAFNKQRLDDMGIVQGETICLVRRYSWDKSKTRCVVKVNPDRGDIECREVTKSGTVWINRRPFTAKNGQIEIEATP